MPENGRSRRYGAHCSAEELELLRARVSCIGDGIIHYREVPDYTTFTFEVLFGQAAELAREHGARKLIVDLGEVERRPGPEARADILAGVRSIENLEHLIVITGQRPLFNVALKFIIFMISGLRSSTFATLDDALVALRHE